jgi:hypothetical protein
VSLEKNVLGFVGGFYALVGLVLGSFQELSTPVLLILGGIGMAAYGAYREEKRRR